MQLLLAKCVVKCIVLLLYIWARGYGILLFLLYSLSMSEILQIEAAIGSAVSSELYEQCIQTLVKSAWRNSNEDTQIRSEKTRLDYFGEGPKAETVVAVGRFNEECVSASIGEIHDWNYAGRRGEYIGFIGKKALEIRLFGVRQPYRNLGFGLQLLGSLAHIGELNGCRILTTSWADFQWGWFQSKGGFEGELGLVAESVRTLPVEYAGFDPANLSMLT